MRTISGSIEDILRESPFLAEALAEDIVNYSALARKIRPALEKSHLKHFTIGAVVMALKRMQKEAPSVDAQENVGQTVKSLTVRSGLTEYAFQNSRTLLKAQEQLLKLAEKEEDATVHFIRGTYETGIIISESLEGPLKKLTAGESLIQSFPGLSSISIRFRSSITHIPGIYYPFFRALAWRGINVVQVVSGFAELALLFEAAEVDGAFTIIKSLTENSGAHGRSCEE